MSGCEYGIICGRASASKGAAPQPHDSTLGVTIIRGGDGSRGRVQESSGPGRIGCVERLVTGRSRAWTRWSILSLKICSHVLIPFEENNGRDARHIIPRAQERNTRNEEIRPLCIKEVLGGLYLCGKDKHDGPVARLDPRRPGSNLGCPIVLYRTDEEAGG